MLAIVKIVNLILITIMENAYKTVPEELIKILILTNAEIAKIHVKPVMVLINVQFVMMVISYSMESA